MTSHDQDHPDMPVQSEPDIESLAAGQASKTSPGESRNGEWFYERNGASVGPFPKSEIRSLVAAGMITPKTILICGDGKRLTASETSLFDDMPPAPPSEEDSVTFLDDEDDAPPVTTRRRLRKKSGWFRRHWGAICSWLAIVPLVMVVLSAWFPLQPGGVSLYAVTSIFAGFAWMVVGAYAVKSGIIHGFMGAPHERPILYRLGGIGLIYVGLGCSFNGCRDVLFSPPDVRDESPSSPPASRVADDPQSAYQMFFSTAAPVLNEYDAVNLEVNRLHDNVASSSYPDGVDPDTWLPQQYDALHRRMNDLTETVRAIPTQNSELKAIRESVVELTVENAKALKLLHRHSLDDEGVSLKDYVEQRQVLDAKYQRFEELTNAYVTRHNFDTN